METKRRKELKRIFNKLEGLKESLQTVHDEEYLAMNKLIELNGHVPATLLNESNRMDEAIDRLDGCLDSLNDTLGDK